MKFGEFNTSERKINMDLSETILCKKKKRHATKMGFSKNLILKLVFKKKGEESCKNEKTSYKNTVEKKT